MASQNFNSGVLGHNGFDDLHAYHTCLQSCLEQPTWSLQTVGAGMCMTSRLTLHLTKT